MRENNEMNMYTAPMVLGYYQEPIAVEKVLHATEEEITQANLAFLRYMKENAGKICSDSDTIEVEPIHFKRKER